MNDIVDPPTMEHGFVQGRFVNARPDSVEDDGRYPDLSGIAGSVRFTAAGPIHLTGATPPATVVVEQFALPVDSNGWLVDEESADDQAEQPGAWLPVGRYDVEPRFTSARSMPRFSIEVTAEHTKANPLNLTLAAPIILPPSAREVTRVIDRELAQKAAEDAQTSASQAEGYKGELEDLFLGGTEAINDAAVEQYVSNEGTATRGALLQAIDGHINTGGVAAKDRGESVAAFLKLPVEGRRVVGVAGDSTGNATDGNSETDEWVGLWLKRLATRDPSLRIVVRTASQVTPHGLGAEVVINSGASSNPASGADTFTRTGDLEGSVNDSGYAWQMEAPTSADNWDTNGSAAVRTTSTDTGTLILSVGAMEQITVTPTWELTQGGDPSATKDRRIVLAYKDPSNYLYMRIATASNNGLVWSINQRINGAASTITTGPSNAIPTSATPQTPTIAASFDFNTGELSATLGSTTINGAVTGVALDALQGATGIGVFASPTAAGEQISNFAWDGSTAVTVSNRELYVYNGSISGSRLEVQLPIIEQLFPEPLDLLIISSVHNYTTRELEVSLAAHDEFLAAFRHHDSGAGITEMSQNPQLPPSADDRVKAHMERNAALASFARRRGIGYVPVIEAFLAELNWKGLINPDGIHPTPGEHSAEGKTGSSVWTDALVDYFARL